MESSQAEHSKPKCDDTNGESKGQENSATVTAPQVKRRGRGRFKAPPPPPSSSSESRVENDPSYSKKTSKSPSQQTALSPKQQQQQQPSAPMADRNSTKTPVTKTAEPEVKVRGRGRFKAPPSQSINDTNKDVNTSLNDTKGKLCVSKEQLGTVDELADQINRLNFQEIADKQQPPLEGYQNRRNSSTSKPLNNSSSKNQETRTEAVDTADDLTTILECYDFPSHYKTSHLRNMFQEYAQVRGGYTIKWIDDTHALIIFQHPMTAKKAYVDHIHNPVAKVRPYKGHVGSKAPATTPRRTNMAAKRLIFGALGTKVPTGLLDQRRAEREQLNNNAKDTHTTKRSKARVIYQKE